MKMEFRKKARILLGLILFVFIQSYGQEKNFEWNIHSPGFANGVNNEVAYINFGKNRVWGWAEVTITCGYNYQLATGKYTKRYSIGRNVGDGAYFHQKSEVPVIFGPISTQFKLGEFEINANGDLVLPIYHLVSTSNKLLISVKGGSTIPVDTTLFSIINPVVIANSETKDKMSFENDMVLKGKLGLGTLSTGNHKLAVEGSIGAREVKVEAYPNWSDFVFYENYDLPTLNEVEKHIKQKGHLKDIPSAKEVEKNGFYLGEMDAKLLQKIEELTLYTIDQEKSLNSQKNQIEKQNLRIDQQQKEIQELKLLVNELLKKGQ
ncbi:conserved hypothetical protein [Tenacibaculum xiamenense]